MVPTHNLSAGLGLGYHRWIVDHHLETSCTPDPGWHAICGWNVLSPVPLAQSHTTAFLPTAKPERATSQETADAEKSKDTTEALVTKPVTCWAPAKAPPPPIPYDPTHQSRVTLQVHHCRRPSNHQSRHQSPAINPPHRQATSPLYQCMQTAIKTFRLTPPTTMEGIPQPLPKSLMTWQFTQWSPNDSLQHHDTCPKTCGSRGLRDSPCGSHRHTWVDRAAFSKRTVAASSSTKISGVHGFSIQCQHIFLTNSVIHSLSLHTTN